MLGVIGKMDIVGDSENHTCTHTELDGEMKMNKDRIKRKAKSLPNLRELAPDSLRADRAVHGLWYCFRQRCLPYVRDKDMDKCPGSRLVVH